MKTHKNFLVAVLLILLFFSCKMLSNKDDNFEVVHYKKWGEFTEVYMCYTKTTDDELMKQYGTKLLKNTQVGFVYFYDTKSKVKDITLYKDLLDALPDDGYISKVDKSPGYGTQYIKEK